MLNGFLRNCASSSWFEKPVISVQYLKILFVSNPHVERKSVKVSCQNVYSYTYSVNQNKFSS